MMAALIVVSVAVVAIALIVVGVVFGVIRMGRTDKPRGDERRTWWQQ